MIRKSIITGHSCHHLSRLIDVLLYSELYQPVVSSDHCGRLLSNSRPSGLKNDNIHIHFVHYIITRIRMKKIIFLKTVKLFHFCKTCYWKVRFPDIYLYREYSFFTIKYAMKERLIHCWTGFVLGFILSAIKKTAKRLRLKFTSCIHTHAFK